MQQGSSSMPQLEAYAFAAAMAAAAAGRGPPAGSVAPLSADTLSADSYMQPAMPQPALPPQPPRLGHGSGSAFAQYKAPPRPQLCAPPVHPPPQHIVSLAAMCAPLRAQMPALPMSLPQVPASVQGAAPAAMQGMADMMAAAVAAAQHMQTGGAPGAGGGVPMSPLSPMAEEHEASGGGGAPASEKSKASRTRYQEKNRRAQARFRERQRAKQNETGRRMAELEAQLHALKVDRDALSIRAQTLAQCLAQKQQAGGSGSSAAQDSGSAGPADTSGGWTSPSRANSGTASPAARASGGNGGASEAADKPHREYPKDWTEFCGWYQGLVERMAPLLAPAQSGNDPAAEVAVDAAWAELVDVYQVAFKQDELIRTRLHGGPCLPDGAPASPPPTPELWFKVTEALQLSEEQSSGMVRARREFLGALKALLRQRRALNAIIQASVPTECGCHTDVGTQHAKCMEVLALLERNTAEQIRLNTQLGMEVWDRLLTPLQGAVACVGMYPFSPDKLAILTAVATKAGQPDARTLLSAEPPADADAAAGAAVGGGDGAAATAADNAMAEAAAASSGST